MNLLIQHIIVQDRDGQNNKKISNFSGDDFKFPNAIICKACENETTAL